MWKNKVLYKCITSAENIKTKWALISPGFLEVGAEKNGKKQALTLNICVLY